MSENVNFKNTLDIIPFAPVHQNQVIELIHTIQQKEFNIPITAQDQSDLGDIPNFYQQGLCLWDSRGVMGYCP
jgi:hypothetical protein